MTAARHAELLAQLTSFVDSPATVDASGYEVGYITEDSEEDLDDDEEMEMGEVEGIDLEGLRALMEAKRVEEMRLESQAGADAGPSAKIEPIEESQGESDSDSDDSSSADSSDSDSSESSALPARLAQVEMQSDAEDDDESGPAPSGPLKTEHEILEEPVGCPPFERLAQGARVILAGVVVSVVKDPRVGAWEEWKRAEEARTVKEEMDVKVEDVKPEDVKQEDVKVEDVKAGDVKGDDVKQEEATSENVKPEDVKMETVTQDDTQQEDGQIEDIKQENIKQEDGQIEDGEVEVEVSVEVHPAAESDVKLESTSTDAPAQPSSDADASSELKPETTTDAAASAPGNAAAKRARNRTRGKGRNGNGKPQGPPAPTTSGTIVVQAQRPPAGTIKGGTDRLDEDGWLLDGSVIVTEEGQAVAVVSPSEFVFDLY
jgi:hypothetical protein